LRDRAAILERLQDLPAAAMAESEDVPGLIERHVLHGQGVGSVDVHSLASMALAEGAKLRTRYKKSRVFADALGCAFRDTTAH
jgi:hypothetical protein